MSPEGRDAGPGFRFVARALTALALEQPRMHARLLAAMGEFDLAFALADERFTVAFRATGVRAQALPPRLPATRQARIECNYSALFALIDGKLLLEAALLEDRLGVHGRLPALDMLEQGFTTFIHGAVATEAMPALLAAFRAETDSTLAQARN